MPTDEEFAALKQRVAALEDLAIGLKTLLTAYARTQPKQADLLAVADGTVGSQHVAIRDELVAVFERVTGKKYQFMANIDGAAIKKLTALNPASRAELPLRWEECLKTKGFPGTFSIAQFVSRINAFGPKKTHNVVPSIPADPYGS